MSDVVYQPAEPAFARLRRVGAERLLVGLSGACALGFGILALLLELSSGAVARPFMGLTPVGGAVFTFAVAAVFGGLLLFAFLAMEARPSEGSVMALAFAVVLLVFGGLAGLVGGILALAGSILGLLKHARLVA